MGSQTKELTDGQQNFRNGESGRPLVLQDVQTDRTIAVDVGMVELCNESDTLAGLNE